MKNINVEYDMDKNDLDILLQDIVDEHKKKPSLAFIVENYPALLSIFNINTIQMCLENIKEEKKNPEIIKKDEKMVYYKHLADRVNTLRSVTNLN